MELKIERTCAAERLSTTFLLWRTLVFRFLGLRVLNWVYVWLGGRTCEVLVCVREIELTNWRERSGRVWGTTTFERGVHT